MKVTIKKKTAKSALVALLLFGLCISLFAGVGITGNFVYGVNISNISVIAKVNVTNTEPNITSITVDDALLVPANEIDLTANGIRKVICNATIFDYNGVADITNGTANGTFFINSIGVGDPNDNNDHYTNNSCTHCNSIDSTSAYCECHFAIQYYANNSDSWVCQMTVTDNGGTQVPSRRINLSDTETTSPVTVTKLLAINTTTLLDYGNLSVTETSDAITHNVTNVGNIDLNLTLRGFGGENESIGQNVTMICDLGNISFGNQRYVLGSDQPADPNFNTMINLTNQTIPTNLTFQHRINDTDIGPDRNSTIWKLQIPLSVGGLCNGTIIFGAIEDQS